MGKPNKHLSAVMTAPSLEQSSGSNQEVTGEQGKLSSIISDIDNLLSGIGSFDDKAAQVVEKMAQAAYADRTALVIPDERLSGLRMAASTDHATRLSRSPQPGDDLAQLGRKSCGGNHVKIIGVDLGTVRLVRIAAVIAGARRSSISAEHRSE